MTARPFAGLAKADQTELVATTLRAGIATVLGRYDAESIPADATFRALGFDARCAVRLRRHLIAEFGTELPPILLTDAMTIDSVATFLWARLSGVPEGDPASDERTSEWQTESLDLDGYLRRIGLSCRPAPTLAALRQIHRAQVTTIGFDTMDVVLGNPLSIELPDIQRKLFRTARGAVCLEHNLLLAAALERLGFRVTRIAGRPRIGLPLVLPLGHLALLVEVDGVPWLVDAGLGGEAVTEPVALHGGQSAGRAPWQWRVVPFGDDEHVLQALRGDWVDRYSFDLHPQRFIDTVVSQYYSASYPGLPINRVLLAHRFVHADLHVLHGVLHTRTSQDGTVRRRPLDCLEFVEVLANVFDITLTEPQLEAIWPDQTRLS